MKSLAAKNTHEDHAMLYFYVSIWHQFSASRTLMLNFRESMDIPSPRISSHGMAEKTGSKVSTIHVRSILSPITNSFFFEFYVLATPKDI